MNKINLDRADKLVEIATEALEKGLIGRYLRAMKLASRALQKV